MFVPMTVCWLFFMRMNIAKCVIVPGVTIHIINCIIFILQLILVCHDIPCEYKC